MNLSAAGLAGGEADALLRRSFAEAFASAAGRLAPQVRTVRLGGLAVRVEIAGPLLAERLLRPWQHLLDDGTASAAFGLRAWSEEETGIATPSFPFAPKPYSVDGRIAWRHQANGRALADRGERLILAGFHGAGQLTYSDLAKPFRSLLIPLLRDAGRQLIHGGVVAARRGAPGLLLAGRSGSGKSTMAVAALAGEFAFLGDDHVALAREGGRFIAHSLYATCGLAADHLAAFPALPGEIVAAPDRSKRVLLLAPGESDRLASSAGIGAIVIPEIVPGAGARAVPASRGEALRALIPGSISPRLPAEERARNWQFAGLSDLAASLPAFRLEMGRELGAIPAALRELSARLAAP